MKTAKYYYAIFKKTPDAVEVTFPDLIGCVTFGGDWEEALDNAKDVLSAWLAHAELQFIKEPSKHHMLEHIKEGKLVPISVDEKVIASYQKLKRFNVIFPVETLKNIDFFRKKLGLKRSTFLQKAAEAYLAQNV
jgi:predicted RNase H-like HicB family nuclease